MSLLCSTAIANEPGPIPPPDREFRGVWVATVENLDWPSRPGLSAREQQDEAIAILDEIARLNLNAVIWQARPAGDALYESPEEPWSHYLTGQQGEAPGYDPLAFWLEESHRRGLAFHVWFNPYRVRHSGSKDVTLADNHIAKRHPAMAVELPDGHLWLLPTDGAVQDHTVGVIMDVIRRYDIDGVHFDDYFYPYRSSLGGREFPDDEAWDRYRDGGGSLSRGDWRREAVNTLIERLYREIKAERPEVKFGISPFGIWQPGHPEGITGLNAFETLHADSRKWLNEGWVDYYTPQLYWPIHQAPQSFPVLLRWWKEQNLQGRHLWPGLGTFWLTSRPPRHQKTPQDVIAEIMVTRGMIPENSGHIHFRVQWFLSHPELGEALLEGPYARPALVPPTPWLGDSPPPPPEVTVTREEERLLLSWTPGEGADPFLWIVYSEQDGIWSHEILHRDDRTYSLPLATRARELITTGQGLDVTEVEGRARAVGRVAISAVDRLGNESRRVMVETD